MLCKGISTVIPNKEDQASEIKVLLHCLLTITICEELQSVKNRGLRRSTETYLKGFYLVGGVVIYTSSYVKKSVFS